MGRWKWGTSCHLIIHPVALAQVRRVPEGCLRSDCLGRSWLRLGRAVSKDTWLPVLQARAKSLWTITVVSSCFCIEMNRFVERGSLTILEYSTCISNNLKRMHKAITNNPDVEAYEYYSWSQFCLKIMTNNMNTACIICSWLPMYDNYCFAVLTGARPEIYGKCNEIGHCKSLLRFFLCIHCIHSI